MQTWVFWVALFKGFPNMPHIPPPTGHSAGTKETTKAPTPENAPCWHETVRPREICELCIRCFMAHWGEERSLGPESIGNTMRQRRQRKVLQGAEGAEAQSPPPWGGGGGITALVGEMTRGGGGVRRGLWIAQEGDSAVGDRCLKPRDRGASA